MVLSKVDPAGSAMFPGQEASVVNESENVVS